MKLTKREKKSLMLLLVVVSLGAYYYFIITPQMEKLESTKIIMDEAELKLTQYKNASSSEAQLDKRIDELSQKVKVGAVNYFPTVKQEELILLMQDFLNNSELEVTSLTFSEPRTETIGESTLDAMELNITLEGDYKAVNKFFTKIWDFQKRIIVTNVNISKDDQTALKTTIGLDFYHLPNALETGGLYDWYLDKNNKNTDPFKSGSEGTGSSNFIYKAGEFIVSNDGSYKPFEDIKGHWAEKEINEFGSKQYIRGDKDNFFHPDSSITRGEFLLLLDKVFNWMELENKLDLSNSYSDFNEIGTYENVISKAISKGVYQGFIIGYDDNTLRAESPISYKEVESIMERVLEDSNFKWQQIGEKLESEKGAHSVGLDNIDGHMTKAEAIFLLFGL